MARNLTADEVREEHLASMGPHLGPVYNALWNEVAWLHAKWHEYKELYGEKPPRLELLNRASGFFFRIVQDTLWENTLLHLARLTDPSRSAGRQNLTVLQLPSLVNDPGLREQLEALLTEAKSKAEFARDWRNRHIAHRDLDKALGKGAEPLAAAVPSRIHDRHFLPVPLHYRLLAAARSGTSARRHRSQELRLGGRSH